MNKIKFGIVGAGNQGSYYASLLTEGKIENLIKAKGFEECMVYYDTEKVDIIVKSAAEGLTDEQVAQMQDVVLGEVELPAENIRIVEVK